MAVGGRLGRSLLLGGVAGFGTILYALAIGPLTQAMLPFWIIDVRRPVVTDGQ